MSDYQPSKYQEDILDYIRNEKGNLLVNAKAGSGKTSTLIMISEILKEQNKKSLFLAFNKSIVTELENKLKGSDCLVKTLHSTGYSFIASSLYRRHSGNYELLVNENKYKSTAEDYFKLYCEQDFRIANSDLSADDYKRLFDDIIREFIQLFNFCRFYCIDCHNYLQVSYLAYENCSHFRDALRYGLQNYHKVISDLFDISIYTFQNPQINSQTQEYQYYVDYVDMIFFPVYFNMYVPFKLRDYLDYILVDEAQDLSILQQKFLKNLLNNGHTRYIFVGDEKQAIYGFAGADVNSINNIKKNFVLKELPLNICYRCPENIIRVTKDIVPEIEWNKQREDKGKVEILSNKDWYKQLKPGDMILGRLNRDLLEIFIELVLKKKISVKFKNRELVKQVIKDVNNVIDTYIRKYNKGENIENILYPKLIRSHISLKKEERSEYEQQQVDQEAKELIIENRKSRQHKVSKNSDSVDMLIRCMKDYKENGSYNYDDEEEEHTRAYYKVILSFINEFKTQCNAFKITTFVDYLEDFLSGNLTEDVPILSTIHMMKGSEADRIFIYNYPLFPYLRLAHNDSSAQQEHNLQYVAITRARQCLYLVDIEEEKEMDKETNKCSKENVIKLLETDLDVKQKEKHKKEK